MNYNQLLIDTLNGNTFYKLSTEEKDILLYHLIGLLTNEEKQAIVQRLEEERQNGVVYKPGSE